METVARIERGDWLLIATRPHSGALRVELVERGRYEKKMIWPDLSSDKLSELSKSFQLMMTPSVVREEEIVVTDDKYLRIRLLTERFDNKCRNGDITIEFQRKNGLDESLAGIFSLQSLYHFFRDVIRALDPARFEAESRAQP